MSGWPNGYWNRKRIKPLIDLLEVCPWLRGVYYAEIIEEAILWNA